MKGVRGQGGYSLGVSQPHAFPRMRAYQTEIDSKVGVAGHVSKGMRAGMRGRCGLIF